MHAKDVTPGSVTGNSILSRILDMAGTVLCLSRYQLLWNAPIQLIFKYSLCFCDGSARPSLQHSGACILFA